LSLVFDSTAKIPSGFSKGITTVFGDYDQCLDIESSPTENTTQIIQGKYCLATPNLKFLKFEQLNLNFTIKFLNKKTNDLLKSLLKRKSITIKLLMGLNTYISKFALFRFGLCIPSNCEAKHIERAFNKG
jgi:hypothetical protein